MHLKLSIFYCTKYTSPTVAYYTIPCLLFILWRSLRADIEVKLRHLGADVPRAVSRGLSLLTRGHGWEACLFEYERGSVALVVGWRHQDMDDNDDHFHAATFLFVLGYDQYSKAGFPYSLLWEMRFCTRKT